MASDSQTSIAPWRRKGTRPEGERARMHSRVSAWSRGTSLSSKSDGGLLQRQPGPERPGRVLLVADQQKNIGHVAAPVPALWRIDEAKRNRLSCHRGLAKRRPTGHPAGAISRKRRLPMLDHLTDRAPRDAILIEPILEGELERWLSRQTASTRAWVGANRFHARPGEHLLIPGAGGIGAVALGV